MERQPVVRLSIDHLIDRTQRPVASILPAPELGACILCQETQQALIAHSGEQHHHILEIGSWLGFSALLLKRHNPNAIILCVDPWLGSSGLLNMTDLSPWIERSYLQFCANTDHARSAIWPLRLPGVDGAIYAWSCDFRPTLIHIDGSHEYESAWGDIHVCRRLWPEATLVIDDLACEEVRCAVEDLIPSTMIDRNVGVFIP